MKGRQEITKLSAVKFDYIKDYVMLVSEIVKWLEDVEKFNSKMSRGRYLSCPFKLCRARGSRDECGEQFRRRYQLQEHMVLRHSCELIEDSIAEYGRLTSEELRDWRVKIDRRRMRDELFGGTARVSAETTAKCVEKPTVAASVSRSPRSVSIDDDGPTRCKVRVLNEPSTSAAEKVAVKFVDMPDLTPDVLDDDFKLPVPLSQRPEFQPKAPKVTTTRGQYRLKKIDFGADVTSPLPDPRPGSSGRKDSTVTSNSSSALLLDLTPAAGGSWASSDGYNSYSLGDDLSDELFAIVKQDPPPPMSEAMKLSTAANAGHTSAEQSEEIVV